MRRSETVAERLRKERDPLTPAKAAWALGISIPEFLEFDLTPVAKTWKWNQEVPLFSHQQVNALMAGRAVSSE